MATHDIRRAASVDIKYNINESFVWQGTITDSGVAVDLSGKTLVYSVRSTDSGTAIDTATTASEIVISGASNNIVTITIDAISGITERSYYHDLENTTDNKMLFDGKLIAGYGAYGS
jgi:hypothetical protein